MLNNSQDISPSLQRKVPVCQTSIYIEDLNRNTLRTRSRMPCPTNPNMPGDDTPKPIQRVSTKQKNPRRGQRGLTLFVPAISPEGSLSTHYHTRITTMETVSAQSEQSSSHQIQRKKLRRHMLKGPERNKHGCTRKINMRTPCVKNICRQVPKTHKTNTTNGCSQLLTASQNFFWS